MELADHEKASERRFHAIEADIEDLKHHKEKSMTQPINLFEGAGGGGMGAAMGGGLGAGLLGGILGGALLGGNGLFGRNGNVGNEFVTPMQLQTATGSIIDSNQNTVLLQAVGDVKAAVPLSATQTQLAVSNTASDIRAHLGQVENSLTAGQMAINKNVSDAIASSLASQNAINVNVLQQGAATREAVNLMGQANLAATKDASTANLAAISASTSQILAALKDQEITNLNRQLTVAELRNTEDRAEARARATEVNVTQTVNQNQMQLQQQQQQQQIVLSLGQLAAVVGNLQSAVATNSNLIVGNTGGVATGSQTANPVNVRA